MFAAFFRTSADSETETAALHECNDALHDRMVRMLRNHDIMAHNTPTPEFETPMAVKRGMLLRKQFAA